MKPIVEKAGESDSVPRHRKRFAVAMVVLGVCALVVGSVVFRGPIVSWFYLTKLQSSRDKETEWTLIKKLVAQGCTAVVPYLLRHCEVYPQTMFDDQQRGERVQALAGLGAEAIPRLSKALREGVVHVNGEAVVVEGALRFVIVDALAILSKVRPEPAAEAIVECLSRGPREVAFYTIDKIEWEVGPVALPFLISALDSGNKILRVNAAEAIGRLEAGAAGKGAVPSLCRLLAARRSVALGEDDEVISVVRALAGIGPTAGQALPLLHDLLHDVRDARREGAKDRETAYLQSIVEDAIEAIVADDSKP